MIIREYAGFSNGYNFQSSDPDIYTPIGYAKELARLVRLDRFERFDGHKISFGIFYLGKSKFIARITPHYCAIYFNENSIFSFSNDISVII